MRFWPICIALYAGFLVAQLTLPAAAIWNRQGLDAVAIICYAVTAIVVPLSTFMAVFMISRALFPQYWWMGQVLGQDIFEFDGVYFVGLRLSRVPSRLQRILFGADDRFRWWDILFGMMFLVLLVPHVLASVTSYRYADRVLPRRIQFPESLHAATLSSLPLLREWQVKWSNDSVLIARLKQELETLQAKPGKSDGDWYRMAQAELLLAFRPRSSVLEPFAFAPSDRVYFDRGQGARATSIARRLMDAPQPGERSHRADAIVLIGFFHLSDFNFARAAAAFREALDAAPGKSDASVPRPILQLLTAHSAALSGDLVSARRMVEVQLADDTLTPPLQALTFEQLADILRMQANYRAAQEFLDKALAAYRKQNDAVGIARISMYRAAIYLDLGELTAASQEISRASSQASGTDDLFTYNMVERIIHLLPSVG